ncbi:unnamed protein product, partial [marine sediment metagenome]
MKNDFLKFNKRKIGGLEEHFIDVYKTFRENIGTSHWEEKIRKAANLNIIYRKYRTQNNERVFKLLLSDSSFRNLLYETIYSWMGQGRQWLKRKTDYLKAIDDINEKLEELRDESLENLVRQKRGIYSDLKEKIKNIFIGLEVTNAHTKIVANSKTLHFLLPDLIPPIDGKYILRFFGINSTQLYNSFLSLEKQAELLIRIMDSYYEILDFCFNEIKQKCTQGDFHDYSIPKIIDNAIWGYSEREVEEGKNFTQVEIITGRERKQYDHELFWDMVGREAGNKLYTDAFVITEDDSARYFGKSIKNAMSGKCILEEGDDPKEITATIPKHIGEKGFSCRVGINKGKKY